jgi:hypothetical protein
MATAVSDRSNHAAPDHFRDRAKPGGITGQSPLPKTTPRAPTSYYSNTPSPRSLLPRGRRTWILPAISPLPAQPIE